MLSGTRLQSWKAHPVWKQLPADQAQVALKKRICTTAGRLQMAAKLGDCIEESHLW